MVQFKLLKMVRWKRIKNYRDEGSSLVLLATHNLDAQLSIQTSGY